MSHTIAACSVVSPRAFRASGAKHLNGLRLAQGQGGNVGHRRPHLGSKLDGNKCGVYASLKAGIELVGQIA